MFQPIYLEPLSGYKVPVRYADGVEGAVDLSNLVGKGVFALWNDPKPFENFAIGENGEIRWGGQVDLCPDALYLQITGKSPEDVFPSLKADVSA